jgi:hypothetical protein
MGRPTDLTPTLQKKIVAMIRDGVSPEIAAVAAGISRATYYAWRARGREESAGPYLDFLDAVEKAIAECEARAVHVVAKAFGKNWQAAMTLMERRFPDRWSRRDRLDVYHQVQREAERIAAELGVPVEQVLRETGVQFPVTTN